ncbi:MAG: S1C family serine protease [Limnochordia bacterium]
MRSIKSWRGLAAAAGLTIIVLGFLYALPASRPSVPEVLAAPSASTGSGAAQLLSGLGPYAVADVAEAVSPAVVYVEVEYKAPQRSSARSSPFSGSPFGDLFDMFWFGVPQIPRQGVSQGSGFIISEDGQILTNQHLLDDSDNIEEIRVYVQNRTEPYTAKLLGFDYELDLAVLKIDDSGEFPVAKLGDSDQTRIGEFVVAIGNPYGKDFDHTVTVGVLSAKGRRIQIPDTTRRELREYSNLMQTDAAINPGNSGGPLLNLHGEVIGINTAVRADGQGIGFAIPINVAKEVVEDLVTKGAVQRPFIGISYGSITEDIAEYLKLPKAEGVMIMEVIQDTAASKAGLQPWDIIRKIDDREIKTVDDVLEVTQKMNIGDKLRFIVDRVSGGRMRTVSILVTVGSRD